MVPVEFFFWFDYSGVCHGDSCHVNVCHDGSLRSASVSDVKMEGGRDYRPEAFIQRA